MSYQPRHARRPQTRSIAQRVAATSAAAVALSMTPAMTNLAPASATTRPVSTVTQLQAAIDAARPGDVIELASGTYNGRLYFRTSGTADAPITLRPAAGATVTLTASLPMPSCGASGPDGNRTLTFQNGASYWTVEGMNIQGGVMIASYNAPYVQNWFSRKINQKDWQSRRAVPGRGSNSPTTSDNAVDYLATRVGHRLSVSRGISLIDNTITVKGVHSRMASYGVLQGNTITNIACGTGPGVWLALYSDKWKVTGNTVSRIAVSRSAHWMQEGIRIGAASAYNEVTGNTIKDLPTGGRAFTTDQDASYNTISGNLASSVDIAFNEQMSGWGNEWTDNRAENARVAGFSFRAMDGKLSRPSMDSSPNGAYVRCNVSKDAPTDFKAGALMNSTVGSNSFDQVDLSANLEDYFTAQDNLWNGRAVLTDNLATPTGASSCS